MAEKESVNNKMEVDTKRESIVGQKDDMWKCKKCGEYIDSVYDICWNCRTTKKGVFVMNNTVKSKLSIVSLVTGILALVFLIPIAGLMIGIGDAPGMDNYILITFFSLFSYLICLPIPAIICGIIDLKKIKAGLYSNKGTGFDTAGIILGGIATAYFIFPFSLTIAALITGE
jgi:hypothetical protein